MFIAMSIHFIYVVVRLVLFLFCFIITEYSSLSPCITWTGCFFLFVMVAAAVASNGSQIPTTGTGSTSAGGVLGAMIPLCNGKKSESKWLR